MTLYPDGVVGSPVHMSGLRSAGDCSSCLTTLHTGSTRRVGSLAPPLAKTAARALSWGPTGAGVRAVVALFQSERKITAPLDPPGSILSLSLIHI